MHTPESVQGNETHEHFGEFEIQTDLLISARRPDLEMIVKYWPSTEPSIKRCTSVNKLKNSASKWTLENNITRCPGGSSQLETGCRSENQLQTEGFGPLGTPGWATQAKMRKKYCYGRGRTWVNIVVRPFLYSFLTHNKHHLFENKKWEIYIICEKCIRSLLNSFITCCLFPHIFVYDTCSCIVAIQHNNNNNEREKNLLNSRLFYPGRPQSKIKRKWRMGLASGPY